MSGLPPCYQCNLVDLSAAGGNTWDKNLGTFNGTGAWYARRDPPVSQR